MDLVVLRILDANFNRAREALRVLEDEARFARNDAGLSEHLKRLRHELVQACGGFIEQALLCRDTPADVGTAIQTDTEFNRSDRAHVVRAAGKRLGEALRALEEFSKIDHPQAAARLEQLRYRFYSIEQSIAQTLRPTDRFARVQLYVLITQACCRRDWLVTAEQAIAGGADCLQLREKELESGEWLERAQALVALCRKHRVLSIINDRPDIALLSDADGVHLGQGDLPATQARKLLGRDKLIGVSTHRIEQARQAAADGADYLGVGPVFPSATKPREILPGLDYARQVAETISIPAVAIAGITLDNVEEVRATGLRAVAVTAAVCAADDVRQAAERFKHSLSGKDAHDRTLHR